MRAGFGRGVGVVFLFDAVVTGVAFLLDGVVTVTAGALVLASVLDAIAGAVPQPAINTSAVTNSAMGSQSFACPNDLMRASM